MLDYDLIIIGSGPAGMNACLYASKAKLKTLVIERDCPGGKMVRTNVIENWIGTEKISGADLSLQMFKHAFSFGGEYKQGNVLDIKDFKDYKKVVLEDRIYTCYAVIISIGTSEKKIGIKGEDKFYGKGVSYCAICDASLYKNKTMVVIGNTKHALDETLYLSKFAKKIYLINSKNSFEADDETIKNIEQNNIIEIKYNCNPMSIEGNNSVEKIIVEENGKILDIETSVVFPFLGDNPDTKFIEKMNLVDEKKHIIVNDQKETKIAGIYAAGDCTNTKLKQIITASSDGALAAMEAYKYIKKKAK